MITGHFFTPEYDKLDDSVVNIFRYTPLVYNTANNESLINTPPVYVIFNSGTITFYFQGMILTDFPVVETTRNMYVQTPILTIPLGKYFFEDTYKDIIDIFGRALSLKIDDGYKFKSFPQDEEKLAWSNLYVFDFPGHEWENLSWSAHNCIYRPHFLKRLLLDFLDDFFNGTVFNLSPKYHDTRGAILNSYVLKGIYLKADFFIKKQSLEDAQLNLAGGNGIVISPLENIRHLDALTKWIEFINYLFTKNSGWFDYSASELKKAVLKNNSFSVEKTAINPAEKNGRNRQNEKRHAIAKRTVNYLIRNYEIFLASRIVFIKAFKIKSVWIPLAILLFSSYFLLQNQLNEPFKWVVLILLDTLIAGIGIIVSSLIFHFHCSVNLVMPRLLMTITTSWIAILSNMDNMKRGFNLKPLEALGYAVVLISVTSFFLVYEIVGNTLITNFWKILRKVVNVVIPGILLSLCIGLFGMTLLIRPYLIQSDFFDLKVTVRENIEEFRTRDNQDKTLTQKVEKLKMQLLITDQRFIKPVQKELALADSALNDFREKHPEESRKVLYDKLHRLHLNDGAEGNGQLKGNLTNKNRQLAYFYNIGPINRKIIVLPGYLLLMASFAYFSGIFLTLLFDNKPVTDPL